MQQPEQQVEPITPPQRPEMQEPGTQEPVQQFVEVTPESVEDMVEDLVTPALQQVDPVVSPQMPVTSELAQQSQQLSSLQRHRCDRMSICRRNSKDKRHRRFYLW